MTINAGVYKWGSGLLIPTNVFWQVAGSAELGRTVDFGGVILGQTSITLGTGASIDRQLFAQTAVTLDASTVTRPSP